MTETALDLDEIQGDLLVGMQKNAELFLIFKIADAARFKTVAREYVVGRLTNGRTVQERQRMAEQRHRGGSSGQMPWLGMNLGFTKDGLTLLLGVNRPRMDPAFERGADHPETIATLNDIPPSQWVPGFRSDGVFLVTGPDKSFVTAYGNTLRGRLGTAVKTVYSEIGTVRPGRERGHEHFGFLDGISQPGIRGVTPVSRPSAAPEQGLPGQDLLWPGEFVLGYHGQDSRDPVKRGPIAPLPALWAKNGSYMVFRRLEQKVPEFFRFVQQQAARLGMDPQLLAARMVGRWRSGAPLELAPLRDDKALGGDAKRNNNFGFDDDRFQRRCPYAAHIRKVYPRDDIPLAEAQRHRIIRQGIPFGPEVEPGETITRHSRGLMFVSYQASIEQQFEYIQRKYADNPDFVSGKERPGGGGTVVPGFDPIIGQAPSNGACEMDEPFPNYPAGNRRTTLVIPHQFVVLTAAAYFFMPSITALRTVLTR
jgi:Dyp-type peroxidase family